MASSYVQSKVFPVESQRHKALAMSLQRAVTLCVGQAFTQKQNPNSSTRHRSWEEFTASCLSQHFTHVWKVDVFMEVFSIRCLIKLHVAIFMLLYLFVLRL